MHAYAYTVINAATAIVLFFGGAACIAWSVNVKRYSGMPFDVNTTGVATQIAPMSLAFDYAYESAQRQRYASRWLPTFPFDNASTASLAVAYASSSPACSVLLNVPGMSGHQLSFGDGCGSLVSSVWFWPLLLATGIASMSVGGAHGLKVVHCCRESIARCRKLARRSPPSIATPHEGEQQ
jgi:hypothetical protein